MDETDGKTKVCKDQKAEKQTDSKTMDETDGKTKVKKDKGSDVCQKREK